MQLEIWGCCKPPSGPGQNLGGGRGGRQSLWKILKFCILRYPDEAKNHPVYPCTEYKVRRKTHQVQEPMKKGKFAQHVFITLSKLKLQMNLQIILHTRFHNFRQVEATNELSGFLACTETYAKKSRPEIFF